jgi:dTDP-4-dehydrorhamnose reductase
MTHQTEKEPLQVWGGVEPTINRVGDRYFRQLDQSGHRDRLSDLDRFAELGLRTLRFPILWEEVAPESLDECDWTKIDAQLERLCSLGIGRSPGCSIMAAGRVIPAWSIPRFRRSWRVSLAR